MRVLQDQTAGLMANAILKKMILLPLPQHFSDSNLTVVSLHALMSLQCLFFTATSG